MNDDELIFCNSFGKLRHPNLINGVLEDLPNLFQIALDNPTKQFVLLTSGSDYGLHLQQNSHPNLDLWKRVQALDWNKILSHREAYAQIENIISVDPNWCDPRDTFSVKVDRYTKLTFEFIPENIVKWYTTNLNIVHEKVEFLPFGINFDGDGWKYLQERAQNPLEKDIDLFVCFTNFSLERVELWNLFTQNNFPAKVVVKQPDMPVKEYLDYISRSRFVLSPYGNGLDCFRTYESLYLDALPIIPYGSFSYHFDKSFIAETYNDINLFLELNDFYFKENYNWMRAIGRSKDKNLNLNNWFYKITKECEAL